jgi:hypothetical protein
MRIFEKLDTLNQRDDKEGTSFVGVCNQVTDVNKKGHNGYVTIGIPGEVAQEMILYPNSKRLMLCIVDGAEYDKL